MGCWVRPGTPSMSQRMRTPCECSVVDTGRWLARLRSRMSPDLIRTSLPGSESPYAHDLTVRPPRSRVVSAAVSLNERTGPDPRFLSTARTSGSDGFTYPLGPLGTKGLPPWPLPWCSPGPGCEPGPEGESDPEQPARSPEPAAAIEAPSTVRRVGECMNE